MSRWPGVDPFLSHFPDAKPVTEDLRSRQVTRNILTRNSFTRADPPQERADWLPVLVRLPHPKYTIPLEILEGFTESVRLGNVLSGRGSKRALVELGRVAGVTVEVSREGGTWELDTSLRTVKGHSIAAPESDTVEERCIVGIVDGGVDPMHQAFLGRDGKTRLAFVWDQTGAGGLPPKAIGFSFDYGVIYERGAINASLARGEALVIPPQGPEDERVHGTHVASIAAGRRTVDDQGQPSFAGGMAPDAPIVFVVPALRTGAGERSSQGFAKSHVDALSFINQVARRLELPAVVNVSAGIAAGAHDGSSTLEAGFDAFTDGGHAPGRAVVKSAGNTRDAGRYGRLNLANGAKLKVGILPLNLSVGHSIVEAWFSSGHELELTLAEGDRVASKPLSCRNPVVSHETKRGIARLSYERFHRDNGDSQILLSLPESDDSWTLTFSGVAMRGKGEIDLWVEGPVTLTRPSPERTLTMPGSARTVITVASSDRAGEQIADTSSHGPTRDGRQKPELFAPGVDIRAAKAGSRFGTVPLSGTSMAAPHVTGAIALLFSKQSRLGRMVPNAVQTSAALVATASKDGNWQADRGYGLLNAQQLLAAFDRDVCE